LAKFYSRADLFLRVALIPEVKNEAVLSRQPGDCLLQADV
jgi:hypothetical protein